MDGSQGSGTKVEAMIERVEVVVAAPAGPAQEPVSESERQQYIAVAAYYLAERRNFEPGHEMEDWLDAEAQARAQTEGLKGFPA